jgi:hypothetical protein
MMMNTGRLQPGVFGYKSVAGKRIQKRFGDLASS